MEGKSNGLIKECNAVQERRHAQDHSWMNLSVKTIICVGEKWEVGGLNTA